MSLERLYTVAFENVTVSALQDLLAIYASGTNGIEVRRISLSAGGVIQSAEIRIRLKRLQAGATVGSGGSAPTIQKVSSRLNISAQSSARANDTTPATSGGTVAVIADWQWNVLQEFLETPPTDDDRWECDASEAIVFDLAAAPGVSTTLSGYITFKETVPSYSAQTLAFFARLATQPTGARAALYNTMINSLVSSGVWAKLDALYMFAAADQPTALTNLVQSTYGATNVNSTTFTTDVGYTGDGTSMNIDTGFNPITASSPNFVQNSLTTFGWSNSSANLIHAMAGFQTNINHVYLYPNQNGTAYFGAGNGQGFALTLASTPGTGLFSAARPNSTNEEGYYNGSASGITPVSVASATLPNSDLLFVAGENTYWSGQCLCGGFGQYLTATDQSNLYSALHTYLQAVAGVP